MQIVTTKDCVEAATPSLVRKTRFRLLAQRRIGRKYIVTILKKSGHTGAPVEYYYADSPPKSLFVWRTENILVRSR
jgi:hypothetical protein